MVTIGMIMPPWSSGPGTAVIRAAWAGIASKANGSRADVAFIARDFYPFRPLSGMRQIAAGLPLNFTLGNIVRI
jgi:hypothetical protein